MIASTYCIIQAALDDGEYVVENRQPARIGTIRNWVELRRLRTVGVSYCGGGADGQKVVVHGKGAAATAVADEGRGRRTLPFGLRQNSPCVARWMNASLNAAGGFSEIKVVAAGHSGGKWKVKG